MTGRPGNLVQVRCDGFILVAVLWILGALAALASVYATYVANTAIALAVNNDAIRAHALAAGAVELAAYQLLTAPDDRRPTHGAFAFQMGGASISVECRTEAARIDINMASKELLAGLFSALGARPNDANQYAERIVGWRSTPDPESPDAEQALYRAAGMAYGPRGAPFPHAGELGLVLGLPPALVERALPYVTVFSGRADVDIVEAAPEVIAALPGMTPERLNAMLVRRASLQPGDTLVAPPGMGQNVAAAGGSKATRVTVDVALDNGRRIVSEAVILIDGRDEPYRVLSWQDDVDRPARVGFKTGVWR